MIKRMISVKVWALSRSELQSQHRYMRCSKLNISTTSVSRNKMKKRGSRRDWRSSRRKGNALNKRSPGRSRSIAKPIKVGARIHHLRPRKMSRWREILKIFHIKRILSNLLIKSIHWIKVVVNKSHRGEMVEFQLLKNKKRLTSPVSALQGTRTRHCKNRSLIKWSQASIKEICMRKTVIKFWSQRSQVLLYHIDEAQQWIPGTRRSRRMEERIWKA